MAASTARKMALRSQRAGALDSCSWVRHRANRASAAAWTADMHKPATHDWLPSLNCHFREAKAIERSSSDELAQFLEEACELRARLRHSSSVLDDALAHLRTNREAWKRDKEEIAKIKSEMQLG